MFNKRERDDKTFVLLPSFTLVNEQQFDKDYTT